MTAPARFIVFAGQDYEARGGAEDQLGAFQHVTEAADAAEEAVTPPPSMRYARCDWSHVAEVRPEGLVIVGQWEVS